MNAPHSEIELEADDWEEIRAWREESEREAIQYEQDLKTNHYVIAHAAQFSDLPF